LTIQLEEESSIQLELRIRESKILELEDRLLETIKYNKELELDSKKKNLEIKKYIEIISESQKK
jgi:hypothetical protein